MTASQAGRIDALFDEFIKPQRERWAALHPLEKQLDDLLREAHPDEKLVFDRITAVEDRRSEINRSRMSMLFYIQRVLTSSQRSKLQDLGRYSFPATGQRNPKTPH